MDNQVKSVKVRVQLNMLTALPTRDLTTDPIIYQAGDIIEVEEELAQKWVTEQYRQSPVKMCERKGGDFLKPEYITRASYVDKV